MERETEIESGREGEREVGLTPSRSRSLMVGIVDDLALELVITV